jgi:hypothetical protein
VLSDLATIGQSSTPIESHTGSLKDVTGSTTISPSRSHLKRPEEFNMNHTIVHEHCFNLKKKKEKKKEKGACTAFI